MRYGSKLNAVLFALLLLTVFVAWYTGRDDGRTTEPLLAVEHDTVRELRIELRGREPMRFDRGPGGWRMREPLDVEAESRRIDEVLNALVVPPDSSYPLARVDADALDVGDEPLARVAVDGRVLVIGGTNPVSGLRYVRTGDAVHLTHDVLYFRLLGDPHGWADRRPLPHGLRVVRVDIDGEPLADTRAWTDAYAYQVRRHGGGRAFERHAAVWLDGANAPLPFGLFVTETGLMLVRTDLDIEYQLPAHGAAAFWSAPADD